ncbi:unnamed protein product, partial [Onchocerca flexuosa]|uniref:Recep_L_domain domain-containing protein n=1 Tax=Onchocerca flexuosa TaxID=387005 RepID=A0A183HWZ8_9BILA
TNVNEGLIIHGTILSLETNEPIGKLKLALIYGQLRLTIANLAEISFDNVTLDSDKSEFYGNHGFIVVVKCYNNMNLFDYVTK